MKQSSSACRCNTQTGNAMFIILIAVAAFAALSFAIASSRNDYSKNLTEENARLLAGELIQYGDGLRVVTDKMIGVRDVDDINTGGNGILFAASNANAIYGTPGDQPKTELFNASGGGASYATPPDSACESACAYEFSGQFTISDVGTSEAELAMVVIDVDATVCKQINKTQNTGWASIPTEDAVTLNRFAGTNYGASAANPIAIGGAMAGLQSFCYQESSGAERYIFLHVLRAR